MSLSENLNTWEGMNIGAIENAYNKIYPLISDEFPDSKTRTKLKKLMEAFLPEYEIKCDEENNPPELVDTGNVMVRVLDKNNMKYVDVVF